MKKKWLALLLTVVLVFCMVACAAESETSEQASETEEVSVESKEKTPVESNQTEVLEGAYDGDLDPVKVGFICWGFTDGLSQGYVRSLDFAAQYCGFEVEYTTYGSYEEIISCAENLIQAGCQIILTTKASTALLDLCDANQVYLAQWGSPISDEELHAYLAKSDYWVGCSTVDDYDAGYQCVESLYAEGCRNIVLMGTAAGNYCHDLRFQGMYDAVALHDDLTVLGEFRSSSMKTEGAPALQNFVALYPELDGVVASGASSGVLEAVVQTLDTEGKLGTVKFATLDIQPGTGDFLEEGSLSFIGGGQFLEVMFLAIDAVNVYDGAYAGDNQIDTTFIYLHNAEEYNDYVTYVDGDGVYPYTAEEVQSITWRCNENTTFEELYDMWNGYSLASIKAKNS